MKSNDKAKKLNRLFVMLALLISHIGCIVCAYEYADITAWCQWASHSAPYSSVRANYWIDVVWTLCPKIVLFLVAVMACLIIAKKYSKKYNGDTENMSNKLVVILVCTVSHLVCCIVPYVIRYNDVIAESINWSC